MAHGKGRCRVVGLGCKLAEMRAGLAPRISEPAVLRSFQSFKFSDSTLHSELNKETALQKPRKPVSDLIETWRRRKRWQVLPLAPFPPASPGRIKKPSPSKGPPSLTKRPDLNLGPRLHQVPTRRRLTRIEKTGAAKMPPVLLLRQQRQDFSTWPSPMAQDQSPLESSTSSVSTSTSGGTRPNPCCYLFPFQTISGVIMTALPSHGLCS
jgi:hypothetical protein